MPIETDSIGLYQPGQEPVGKVTSTPVAALQHLFRARATRKLIRDNEDRGVRCALRYPIVVGDERVVADELARKLRRVIRLAVASAAPGDLVIVDFIFVSTNTLEVGAGLSQEMNGPDPATYEAMFRLRSSDAGLAGQGVKPTP